MTGLVIVGAGSGIGASVARRFAREGFSIGLIARREETLRPIVTAVAPTAPAVMTRLVDAGHEVQLEQALAEIEKEHGVPDVLVYNAAVIRRDEPGELSKQELLDTWAVNVWGGLRSAATIGPKMAERRSGTIIFTGGMPKAVPRMTSLSLGKAALRSVAELLAEKFGADGVHVATVTVSGGPVAPGGRWDPDEIAEHFWELHRQGRAEWLHEVVH